jgi:hypothetical protein
VYRQYQSTDVEIAGHSPYSVEGKYTRTEGLLELS